MTVTLARRPPTRARVVDERALWIAATSTDNRWACSALAWFEDHIELGWPFGCWMWRGWQTDGYGKINVGDQTWSAHRFSFEIHRGSAFGLDLDHECRISLCVNAWHLEPVTNRVNAQRARGFNARLRHGMRP